MRNHHLWDVVATLLLLNLPSSYSNYSPHFLTYVDQVLIDLVHNAFFTEGQWYNMTKNPEAAAFGLFYDKVQLTTDPTGVYKTKSKRELPFIYQSAPPAKPCVNAASTSIISGSKAVDFAAFAIGIMTLVINSKSFSYF